MPTQPPDTRQTLPPGPSATPPEGTPRASVRPRTATSTSPLLRHLRVASEGEPGLPPLLAGAVRAALASTGGELEIGSAPNVGWMFFAHGGVAWVVAPSGAASFPSLLRRRASLSSEALRGVIATCRETSRSFVDVLIEERLVERDVLRAIVLEHNARQLGAVLEHPLERVEFHPTRRRYHGDLTFSLEELLAEMARLAREGASSPAASPTASQQRNVVMANINASLNDVMTIDGAIATAIVDWESGLTLGTAGGGPRFDVELAASGNTAVVKSKMSVMRQLGIPGAIEDILITLQGQYHLIRPLAKNPSLFLYVAIDKAKGNLGLARHKLKSIEEALTV